MTVFFHMRPLNASTVPSDERYTVSRVNDNDQSAAGPFRLIIRHGYNDHVVTADLAALVLDQLRTFIMHEGHEELPQVPADGAEKTPALDERPDNDSDSADRIASELAFLQKAFDSQVTYLVGKQQMRIRDSSNIIRRILLSAFLWTRENTRSRVASMKIPADKLVEVGFINDV